MPRHTKNHLRQHCIYNICFIVIVNIYCTVTAYSLEPTKNFNVCPSANPTSFIEAYSNNIDLQKKYLNLPLKYTYVINDPTSREYLQEKILYIDDVSKIPYIKSTKTPIFPSAKTQIEEGLRYKIRKYNNKFALQLYKPDTDYINVFVFYWVKDCWSLQSISSKSL